MSHAINPHEIDPVGLPVDVEILVDGVEDTAGNLAQTAASGALVAGQVAIVTAEMNPLINEVGFRIPLYLGAEVASHGNPLVGAAALGLSTLAIEGSAAWAASGLLGTERAVRWEDKAHDFVEKHTDSGSVKLPWKIAGTALFGTVAGMEIDRYGTDRTPAESRRFGFRAAAALSGTLAVVGAMGPEVVNQVMQNADKGAKVAVGAGALEMTRRVVKTLRQPAAMPVAETVSDGNVWYDKDKHGNTYGIVKDYAQLEKAAVLEQDVWTEKAYGDLEEEGYLPHIAQSRTFAAFNGEDCVGVTRMFIGNDEIVPPFTEHEMPYYDETEREKIMDEARVGDIEELGTAAVATELRGQGVNLRLWRLAYRDARARGIKKWGIIMEPERVEKMNKNHGFTFRQLGDPIPYQGGDCAAFIMDLDEVDKTMKKKHPLTHFWFASKKISA
jgi:hypothetical protein